MLEEDGLPLLLPLLIEGSELSVVVFLQLVHFSAGA